MTDSRLRTVGVGRLLAGAGTVALLLMTCCVALGYRLALSSDPSGVAHATAARVFDFGRPEGRVLVDHVGYLSSRLTRVEIEAATLAKRLGVKPDETVVSPSLQTRVQRSPSDQNAPPPSGGPLLPVNGTTALTAEAAAAPFGEFAPELSHLESEIARLEASIEQMTRISAERDLAGMAYPNRLPVLGDMPRISSGFGVRRDPFTGRLARHMGLDIPAARGTAVLASGGGRVMSAGYRGPYGNAIVIDHGDGLQTLYGHCSRLFVRAGELVMPGQKIAAVGSTGRSTGPHLHFEVIRNGARVAPGSILDTVLAGNTN